MRLASLALFLGAAALGATQAIGAENTQDPDHENTYFNAQKVPPLLELTSDNYEKEFGLSKNLVVKFFRYVQAEHRRTRCSPRFMSLLRCIS